MGRLPMKLLPLLRAKRSDPETSLDGSGTSTPREDKKKRRRLRYRLAAGAAACLLALAAYELKVFEPLPLDNAASSSRLVLDREGHLLRAFTTPDGRWRLDENPDEVSATYLA